MITISNDDLHLEDFQDELGYLRVVDWLQANQSSISCLNVNILFRHNNGWRCSLVANVKEITIKVSPQTIEFETMATALWVLLKQLSREGTTRGDYIIHVI
jgi:hypothetical protein